MYRPEGMKENPFNPDELTGKTCFDIWEAGAYAMLEGLKKESLSYTDDDRIETIKVPSIYKGKLVFIPEEE